MYDVAGPYLVCFNGGRIRCVDQVLLAFPDRLEDVGLVEFPGQCTNVRIPLYNLLPKVPDDRHNHCINLSLELLQSAAIYSSEREDGEREIMKHKDSTATWMHIKRERK